MQRARTPTLLKVVWCWTQITQPQSGSQQPVDLPWWQAPTCPCPGFQLLHVTFFWGVHAVAQAASTQVQGRTCSELVFLLGHNDSAAAGLTCTPRAALQVLGPRLRA